MQMAAAASGIRVARTSPNNDYKESSPTPPRCSPSQKATAASATRTTRSSSISPTPPRCSPSRKAAAASATRTARSSSTNDKETNFATPPRRSSQAAAASAARSPRRSPLSVHQVTAAAFAKQPAAEDAGEDDARRTRPCRAPDELQAAESPDFVGPVIE